MQVVKAALMRNKGRGKVTGRNEGFWPGAPASIAVEGAV